MHLISLEEASSLLVSQNIVAIPTETVYGLAANAVSNEAVAKIYALKGRPHFNPLIVHVPDLEAAEHYVVFSELAHQIARHFWPGPLTLILPLKKETPISKLVTNNLPTLGIRVPNHPLALALLKATKLPLAAPSANRSGKISPTLPEHVSLSFRKASPPILEGGKSVLGLESTILDLSHETPRLLRPGFITPKDLASFLPNLTLQKISDIIAPGQLESHYAPRHKIRLNAEWVLEGEGLLAFGPKVLPTSGPILNLSPQGDLGEAASNFFEALHKLDQMELKGIAAMTIPNEGIGIAINDRLNRAAFNKTLS